LDDAGNRLTIAAMSSTVTTVTSTTTAAPSQVGAALEAVERSTEQRLVDIFRARLILVA
jgi:hypothetical protein